jgi:hypothetical protein
MTLTLGVWGEKTHTRTRRGCPMSRRCCETWEPRVPSSFAFLHRSRAWIGDRVPVFRRRPEIPCLAKPARHGAPHVCFTPPLFHPNTRFTPPAVTPHVASRICCVSQHLPARLRSVGNLTTNPFGVVVFPQFLRVSRNGTKSIKAGNLLRFNCLRYEFPKWRCGPTSGGHLHYHKPRGGYEECPGTNRGPRPKPLGVQ